MYVSYSKKEKEDIEPCYKLQYNTIYLYIFIVSRYKKEWLLNWWEPEELEMPNYLFFGISKKSLFLIIKGYSFIHKHGPNKLWTDPLTDTLRNKIIQMFRPDTWDTKFIL